MLGSKVSQWCQQCQELTPRCLGMATCHECYDWYFTIQIEIKNGIVWIRHLFELKGQIEKTKFEYSN